MAGNSEITNAGIYPRGFSSHISWPWPLVKSEDLILLKYGKALRDGDRHPGSVPVYGTNGQCGWHDQPLVAGPGLILGRKGQGHLGVEWCDSSFWVIDTAYFVTPTTDEVDLRYLYYLIKHIGLDHLKDGTSNPGLSRDIFAQLLLPKPPIDTQRAIARILGLLDEKIELNRHMNKTLEAIAQGVFKAWFIDFEPVQSKVEGREPQGMDEKTWALFPSELEESELGPIPKGWRVDEIGNLVQCVGGTTPSTKNPEFWQPGDYHWATPKDLSALLSPVLLNTDRKVSSVGLSKIGSGLLPAGTLLLSSRAPIGYLAVAQVPTAINQGFIAMTPGGQLPPEYLLFWTRFNLESIKRIANGSTFLEISKATFRRIKLVVPSPHIISRFVETAGLLLERIAANEAYGHRLVELRDELLPRLISGQLRVPEAQEALAEALA